MVRGDSRAACVKALRHWEKSRRFSDEILHELFANESFTAEDRAFLTVVFYGILRGLTRLDFLIDRLRKSNIDNATRQLLRLGLYQIFDTRVADHAAVNETVALSTRRRGLVNAILRRALREKESLLSALEAAPAPIRLSHPEFLIDRWSSAFGKKNALALCEWNNQPAPVYTRCNTLKVTPGELLRSQPDAELSSVHPLMIRVRRTPFTWIVGGLCYVQDPSTLIACELLAPRPRENILDACAAPGGKASYLAQLMGNTGSITACDSSPGRLRRLRQNLQRLQVTIASVVETDWLRETPRLHAGSFDRILLDAPCSNTGVIRRRVDARWRLQPGSFELMQKRQVRLLKAVVPYLKPGGRLVYSTCSLEREENEDVIALALASIPGLHFLQSRSCRPFVDSLDGAYAAELTIET